MSWICFYWTSRSCHVTDGFINGGYEKIMEKEGKVMDEIIGLERLLCQVMYAKWKLGKYKRKERVIQN